MGRGVQKRQTDCFLNTFGVDEDFGVPEPKHPVTRTRQPGCSAIIVGRLQCMLPTIKFDDQPCRMAGKVRDIRSDRHLSPEAEALELLSAQ